MNLVELDRALRQLPLSGMAAVLETRLRQAQTEKMAPLDLVSALVADELRRRQDRLLERRHKLARFRDPERSLDTFDFDFNKKMNRALVYELATAGFIAQREDVLFLGAPGTGLLIIDDLRMRKLAHTAAEDLLELIMRRYERASTLLTSNRPVDDWGKLLEDTAAVTALLDRLLHHAHVLKCGPRSWRPKVHMDLQSGDSVR
jgi:DNA replication protein DnaC